MGAADKANPSAAVPLRWQLIRLLVGRIVSAAARRALVDRTLTDNQGNRLRWLRPEIEQFLTMIEKEAEVLRPIAHLETLPTFGNRLMVELAVYTAACDRALRHQDIAPCSAQLTVADLGWDIYRRMLSLSSFPARLVTRDPGRRLQWTISMLLRFPFNAPGVPGYAVDSKINGEDILTHFPPQTFARRLSEDMGDPDALEAFRTSWCLYDWAGADVIAGDARRGHYRREHTLSHGEPVCDMCWLSRGAGAGG